MRPRQPPPPQKQISETATPTATTGVVIVQQEPTPPPKTAAAPGLSYRLAKEGSKKRPAIGYQVVSHAFLKRSTRQQAMTEWATQWEQRRSTRSFMGSPKRRIHPILAHASKRDASRVIQIRSGHGYFNAYLGTIPKSGVLCHCLCGNYNQTPEHLVLYCRWYAQQRQDHLQHLITRAPDGSKRLDIFSAVGTQQLLLFLQATPIALRPQVAREWVSGFGDISQDLD
ncbi:hypothetical protein BJ508DRAFT_327490 [Ascobolus immersus RN42]|uniref:Reverse transcriptase zinc-binding domain-containing protein n=1 Tax=Ascobolus immersus RN42 TaxID=1160509 RepID=A0A3N4I4I1_ASCIM|nr:hypothetical protein BJ508DRAFT_327490 [Ascobolus immersus RN42]